LSVEPSKILILADESANWKIAGLRQLERVVLAVNEFAESKKLESRIDVIVFGIRRFQSRNDGCLRIRDRIGAK